MRRLLLPALLALVVPLSAAEVSTIATAALQGTLVALAGGFKAQTGHDLQLQFDTSPNINRRLASGLTVDVLIGPPATIDQLIKEGKAMADTRATVGKVGVGVAVNRGGRRPDISTPAALKAALLAADAVVYSQGASGVYVEKMLAGMGIAEALKGKAHQVPTGEDVMHRMGTAKGNEIGFTMVAEIKFGESHGGSLVGPLPEGLQSLSTYDAVVMSNARTPEAARAFIRSLGSSAAKQVLTANGWQP